MPSIAPPLASIIHTLRMRNPITILLRHCCMTLIIVRSPVKQLKAQQWFSVFSFSLAEMLATLQRPATTVIPRDTSKPRFNHPKGAPDVNDIFNAKGNRWVYHFLSWSSLQALKKKKTLFLRVGHITLICICFTVGDGDLVYEEEIWKARRQVDGEFQSLGEESWGSTRLRGRRRWWEGAVEAWRHC